MKRSIDELLETEYYVLDILPYQVPSDSKGQYFAVEDYYLKPDRLTEIKKKHINVILKLNCFRDISLDDQDEINPKPVIIEKEIQSRYVCIRVDDAMIVSRPDETHITLFSPDSELLELIRQLCTGEGLFVFQPCNRTEFSKGN